MSNPIPIPIVKLLEIQELLAEASKAADFPADPACFENCLRARLGKAAGRLAFYTGEALLGITVPIEPRRPVEEQA